MTERNYGRQQRLKTKFVYHMLGKHPVLLHGILLQLMPFASLQQHMLSKQLVIYLHHGSTKSKISSKSKINDGSIWMKTFKNQTHDSRLLLGMYKHTHTLKEAYKISPQNSLETNQSNMSSYKRKCH